MSLAYGEDISEHFPTELDIALQNKGLFEAAHVMAERDNLLHPIFFHVLADLPNQDGRQLVVQGISLYEIVAAFERTDSDVAESLFATTAVAQAALTAKSRSPYELIVEGNESLEESVHEVPRLIDFGSEVLGRYANNSPDLLGYGLVGIALARLYDMSSAAQATQLEIQDL